MGRQTTIEVKDLTKKAPGSDLAVIVRFEPEDRYVEVFRSGVVRLISSAGTVSAQFKELEKRDLLRQGYIQTLLTSGVKGEELERALRAIARVDQRLAEEMDTQAGIADLERRTEARLRAWGEARGLDYESLSEEEFTALVQHGVAEIRRAK
ncbi:MAG: hypothetical protein ISS49_02095 [Anaerolineae bacterium]|nr:hypothetical protein [Anaerolineae bacterium]